MRASLVIDDDGSRHVVEESVACNETSVLEEWLALSWQPIQRSLAQWTVDDLSKSYPHRFQGTEYLISRQWTLFRILAHDIHHGGQLALMLAMLGVEAFELRALGGHIVSPVLAKPDR